MINGEIEFITNFENIKNIVNVIQTYDSGDDGEGSAMTVTAIDINGNKYPLDSYLK